MHVDHFGNLVTNITAAALPPLGDRLRITLGRGSVLQRLHRTYTEVPAGDPVARPA